MPAAVAAADVVNVLVAVEKVVVLVGVVLDGGTVGDESEVASSEARRWSCGKQSLEKARARRQNLAAIAC